MVTSRYVREVTLPVPVGEDLTHVCYNLLRGTVMGAPREIAEVLARGREGELTSADLEALGSETAQYLLAEGWLLEGEADEEAYIEDVRTVVHEAASVAGEYGVVPWPTEDPPLTVEQAWEVAAALAEAEQRQHRQYHLYAMSPEALSEVGSLAGPVAAHWEALPVAEGGSRALVLTVPPTAQLDWSAWGFLGQGEGRLRIPLHAPLAEGQPFPEWIDEAAERLTEAGQVGFAGWLMIYTTPDDPDGWLDTMLGLLSSTGLLYHCVRAFFYVPKRSVADWREHLCELDNMDFARLQDALRESARSRRRSLLQPHGGGLVHKIDALLTSREPLRPDTYYCTAIARGYYVNLAGEVWPCPKMAAGLGREAGASPIATYDAEGIYPDVAEVRRWRDREVTAIEGCRGCPGLLACAGGCALEAVREHAGDPYHPAHQPVEELMSTVIRTQQRRLTREFGPRRGARG